MTIVCWGNLAKSADDTQKIEQSIQDYVSGHDENANAHMGADYSLGAHRLAVEIDHLPYSVLNKLIYPQARTYKAIVDPAEYGDSQTIQNAIDYVNSLGGGKVFIKNGIYTLTSDLILYSNISLEGESLEGVEIDFDSGNYQVLISGSGVTSPAGLIAVTHDDATVTGTTTDFENEVNIDDYILIDDTWYKVSSITDSTHLELVSAYVGIARSSLGYLIMTPKTNISLSNLTIKNSVDNEGLKLAYLMNCFFDKITVNDNADIGLKISYLANCAFKDVYANNNVGHGMSINFCQSTYFIGLSSYNNGSAGYFINGTFTRGNMFSNCNASHNDDWGFFIYSTLHNTLIGCDAIGNVKDGFYLSSASRSKLLGCSSYYNGDNGLLLQTSCDKNRFIGCEFQNNGDYGANVENSCDKNVFDGLDLTNNISGAKSDLGSDNVWGDNVEA